MFTSWKLLGNSLVAFDGYEILEHVAITYVGQCNFPQMLDSKRTMEPLQRRGHMEGVFDTWGSGICHIHQNTAWNKDAFVGKVYDYMGPHT